MEIESICSDVDMGIEVDVNSCGGVKLNVKISVRGLGRN